MLHNWSLTAGRILSKVIDSPVLSTEVLQPYYPVAVHLHTLTELPYPKAYCTPMAEGLTVVGEQLCPAA